MESLNDYIQENMEAQPISSVGNVPNADKFKYMGHLEKFNVGIPRIRMPQIWNQFSAVDVMRHLAPKYGVVKVKLPIYKLKPSQNEINPDKVQKGVDEGVNLSDKYFLVSQGNYLADGHHLWASALEVDDQQEVIVYRVNLPIKKLIEILNKMKATKKVDINDKEQK